MHVGKAVEERREGLYIRSVSITTVHNQSKAVTTRVHHQWYHGGHSQPTNSILVFSWHQHQQARQSVWSRRLAADCRRNCGPGNLKPTLQLQRILVYTQLSPCLHSYVFIFVVKCWNWSLYCRYIYNLLDFNDMDSFFASEKPDLASPPESHWDIWSSTLVDLDITPSRVDTT